MAVVRLKRPWSLYGWLALAGLISAVPNACGTEVLLGSPLGEADNHLWMWWRSLQPAAFDPLSNRPVGDGILLMDPLNIGAFALGSLGGPAMGWNLTVAWAWALWVAGAGALGRRWGGARAGWISAIFAGCHPIFWGLVDFGITEMWAVGWLGLHLACLDAYREGGRWNQALLAGICLGAAAASGWYLALFALVVEFATLFGRIRSSLRWGVLFQGAVAAGMVLPSLIATWDHRGEWSERIRQAAPHAPGPRADWADLPVYGTDMLAWVWPRWNPVEPSKAAYMGLSLLVLATFGLSKRKDSIIAVGALFALSLGIWPSLAGEPLGFRGAAGWLTSAFPPLQGISHWGRAGAAAVPILSALAALGTERLCGERGGWRNLILGLVLLESVLGSPTTWPRPTIKLELPPILTQLEGRGGVIQLPFDNGRIPFSTEPARLFNRWQVLHQHPVAENYEGVDALLVRSPLIAAADRMCWVRSTLPLHQRPPPEWRNVQAPQGGALSEDLANLRAWGFEWIVLHRERCRSATSVIQLMEEKIGGGEHPGGPQGDWRWRIRNHSSN